MTEAIEVSARWSEVVLFTLSVVGLPVLALILFGQKIFFIITLIIPTVTAAVIRAIVGNSWSDSGLHIKSKGKRSTLYVCTLSIVFYPLLTIVTIFILLIHGNLIHNNWIIVSSAIPWKTFP